MIKLQESAGTIIDDDIGWKKGRAGVVEGSQNRPDLHFPPRIKAKISEYASNLTFQITLSFLVIRNENTPDFILPSGSSGKNFRFFNNSPQTLNLVIKLKFRKKSEIFEKI